MTSLSNIQPTTAASANPCIAFDQALCDLTSRETGPDRDVVRVFQDGRPLGHMRMRSYVNEGDRLKFYGLSFFLDSDDALAVRRETGSTGQTNAVELDTPYGTLRFDSPPGLRQPSRRRANIQNQRSLRKGR